MNKLNTERRARILHCIVEGNTLRPTARLTDTAADEVVEHRNAVAHGRESVEVVADFTDFTDIRFLRAAPFA
jgi:hypothetical protein